MATSSIFANFIVSSDEAAQKLADFLIEGIDKEPPTSLNEHLVLTLEEVDKFLNGTELGLMNITTKN